jgi:hypothetical protein
MATGAKREKMAKSLKSKGTGKVVNVCLIIPRSRFQIQPWQLVPGERKWQENFKFKGSRTVVECLPHHTKIKGSNQAMATGARRGKVAKSLKFKGSGTVVKCLLHHTKVKGSNHRYQK